MKGLIFIFSSLLIAGGSYAQSGSGTNPLFNFDNAGSPKEIATLGNAPEFPFLRHMSSPIQLYAAIMRNEEKNTQGVNQLNDLLISIGFSRDAKDLSPSDISMAYIAPGTEGNMGSAGYKYGYYKLSGDAQEFKAWKITGTNGYVYLLAKCGDAFYPKAGNANITACITAPVSLTGDNKTITLTSSSQQITTTNDLFVYYHRRRHHRHDIVNVNPDINDPYPSKPLLLRRTNEVEVIPVTYNISVTTPDSMVSICPGSVLNLNTDINVEKSSEYAGYYPDKDKRQYKEISKMKYKRIARNLRKEERREKRIARLSGVKANV